MARVSKAKAIERLEALVGEASTLDPKLGYTQEIQKWLRDVDNVLFRVFGDDSREYSSLPNSYSITPSGLRSHLNRVASLVESCLDDVKYFWEDNELSQDSSADKKPLATANTEYASEQTNFSKVFVIHGHDAAAREKLARFLQKLGLQPIILHEQPNEGRTIIEKFEDYADVGFATVLLTPDDLGAPKDKKKELKPRARQNVVFELGYFIGRFSRNRVCALIKGDVEKPSDYDGVVYIRLDDAGGWEMKLVRELRTAGFDVDANQVL